MISPFQSCCPWQHHCEFTQQLCSFCLILETTKPDTDRENHQKKHKHNCSSPCRLLSDKINESKCSSGSKLYTNQIEMLWLVSCAAHPMAPSSCDFSSFLWANLSLQILQIPSKFMFLTSIIFESQLWGLITRLRSASLEAAGAFSLCYFSTVTLWLYLKFHSRTQSFCLNCFAVVLEYFLHPRAATHQGL